ncbi:MAG: hypothetical protein IPH57_10970 [Saprospiraceae bacterium]|nr:hypothetical protein [Saprospiraceae bacterium]
MNEIFKDPNYTSDWQKVDSLEQQGLYKSALKITDSIYSDAKINKSTDQKIKALFYKGKYSNYLEEDNLVKFEQLLISEVSDAAQPEKSVLQSILAEFYDNFLSANIWKINDRTESQDNTNTDIQTWSAARFINESNKLYDESMLYADLKNIPYTQFRHIFTESVKTENMRVSLYEILAQRALEHYKNDRNYLPKTTGIFKIDKKDYFKTPESFINFKMESKTTDDPKFKTLLLFRDLEKNSYENKDTSELLDITLNRLEFVKNQYLLQDRDELYNSSLKALIEKYSGVNETAEAYFLLAQSFKMSGEENPEQNKWKIKEALELCNKAENNYPGSMGADQCKALKMQILEKTLNCSVETVNLPDEKLLAEIRFKNLKSIHQKILKVSESEIEELNKMPKDQDVFLNSIPSLKTWEVNLPDEGDYRNHSVESGIDPLNLGTYILITSDNPGFQRKKGLFSYQVFHVSNLAYWVKNEKSGSYVFVLNRKSGAPVENAKVALFEYRWNDMNRINERILFSETLTNREGFVKINQDNSYNSYEIAVSKDFDFLNLRDNIYTEKFGNSQERTSVIFFTDRSIYRPGQTIYYKGLMISYNHEDIPSIVKNKKDVRVQFLDANHQKVNEITTSTNDFGTFNGSFTIPQSGLTGSMFLNEMTTNAYYSFKVEEYKRPKFEVSFEDYKENYKLGDIIKVKGLAQTFAGFPLQNARVNYTVKRKVFFPYYYGYRIPYLRNSDLEIAHGTMMSDENGNFEVPVELFASDLNLDSYFPHFNFEISADVVDISGETHSGSKSINAYTTVVNINLEVPEKTRKEKELKILISATNNSGQKTAAKGRISIFKLKEPKSIFRDRYWDKPDTFMLSREEFYRQYPDYAYKNDDDKKYWETDIKSKEFDFNTATTDSYPQILSDGEYKILLEFDDDSGKKIVQDKYVSVYSDKKNPFNEILLTETDKSEYDIPSSALIKWQSLPESLNVYYSVWKRNMEIVDKNWLTLKRSSDKKINLNEDHRGGVIIASSFIFNNRYYDNTAYVSIPWSNKELSFEYLTFRSKLSPGQNEEWRIKVKGEKAETFVTEILAGMYDASLDKIYKTDWNKTINYPGVYHRPAYSYGFNQSQSIMLYPDNYYDRFYPDSYKSYRNINWFGFSVYDQYYASDMVLRSSIDDGAMFKKGRVSGAGVPESEPMEAESMPPPPRNGGAKQFDQSPDAIEVKMTEKAPETDKTRIQLRSNLNETVFFFPEIRTDEKGNFILAFKMNEALTKWKLRLFSHTKDLKFAYDEKEVITQKDLMVTPNNPRFVRKGDQLKFNVKIENLTDRLLTGSGWVELFDAANMQPVDKIILTEANTKTFSIGGKNSSVISWNMNFDKDIPELIIYRFYAKSGEYSDAEEGFLPVLTNQKIVTESLPLWVRGNETRSFTLQSLKNSAGKDLKNLNYTLESTSHPVWICIQSLPYLKDVKCENTISLTDALFSNMLAKKITDENPQIKRVFEKWQRSGNDINKDALMSSLRKNQELKNILLEETPWVLDAIDDEEQKRNIALLFDLNQVKNDERSFVSKLKSHQNPDGGFPWFISGRSSRYISQYVMETLGKLKKLDAFEVNNEVKSILDRNVRFVNEEVIKDYKKLLELAAEKKIDLEKNNLSSIDIHYLYAIQFYPETEMSSELKQAISYYTSQASKFWIDQPLYLKSMTALILNRSADKKTPSNILKSLEEQSVYSDELGRYWKSYHGYNWWQLPVETQSMIIEAFAEIRKNDKIIDELKIWLLKNKQTTEWKTGKATVSAIFSLLLDNGVSLKETKPVTIYVNNQNITAGISKDDIQAGTGYYKKKWAGKDVKPEMADVKIENTNPSVAWGAVYWQYLQDLDKIKSFEETPLKIVRELYLVKNTDTGKKMEMITTGDKLNTGDQIRVKIRLEVDRPMEFVHLSDQRAAALEPLEQISKYSWQGGLGYYQNPRDTKMNFFIDYLPRGVFVLEYSLRVMQSGVFSNGIAELQSYYAPEFSSHSGGMKIEVK